MPKSEDDQKTNPQGGQQGQEGSEAAAKPGKSTTAEAADGNAAPSTSAGQASASQTSAAADAISLLKQDHRKVDGLFDAFEKATDDGQKDQLIQQICQELIIHTTLEEKIFYPASRQDSTEDELEEAQVEHDSAKFLILELLNGDSGDDYRDAKVKVLAEQIRHHVKEEEAPDGLFAKAQKAGVNTRELAERLSQLKQRLLANAQQHRLPEPEPRSYHQFSHPLSQAAKQEERMPRQSNTRDRDDYGRFTSDENDHRGYGSRGGGQSSRGGGDQDRDDYGRFTSDHEDNRGRNYGSRGGGERDRGGWYGDSQGHSEASGRDWQERSSAGSRSRSYRDQDEDDHRSASRGRGQGGWFGDPEGHAEASRRGWEERNSGGSRSRAYRDQDEDDHRYASRERGHGGWFGDPEGHSEASRRGWEEGSGGGSRSRSYRDEDEDDHRSASRGRGQGGWFGDSEGHSEASRRGWENRR